jgi:hypothetical protein
VFIKDDMSGDHNATAREIKAAITSVARRVTKEDTFSGARREFIW